MKPRLGDVVVPGPERASLPIAAGLVFAFVLVLATTGCGSSARGPADAADGDATLTEGDGPGSGLDHSWPLPRVRVSPAVLDFGPIEAGASSPTQTLTVAVLDGPVAINPTIVGDGFILSDSTCAAVQPPDSVCMLSVTFAPTAPGAAGGVLTLAWPGGEARISLSGICIHGPSSFVVPDRIELGTLVVNQEATVVVPIAAAGPIAALACTSGNSDLTLVSQTCPTVGIIDAPCSFTFTFKAATAGEKVDTVACLGGGRTTVSVVVATVVAATPPVVTPGTGLFAATSGKTDVLVFTVSNTGSMTVGPLVATISTGASVFSVLSNGCDVPILPLASCRIQVGYAPVSADSAQGTLLVVDLRQPDMPVVVPLIAALTTVDSWLTPPTADFGQVFLGGASAPTPFTLQNYGASTSAALTIASSSPDFVVDEPSCPPLAPGAACTFAVSFAPKSGVGAVAAVITVAAPDGALVATAKVSGESFVLLPL